MTRVFYQAASKLSVKVIVTAAKCISSTIDWPLQVHSSALTRLPSPKSSPKPGSRSLFLAKTATYDILELKDHVYARTSLQLPENSESAPWLNHIASLPH